MRKRKRTALANITKSFAWYINVRYKVHPQNVGYKITGFKKTKTKARYW